jgi:hypothetical protein
MLLMEPGSQVEILTEIFVAMSTGYTERATA